MIISEAESNFDYVQHLSREYRVLRESAFYDNIHDRWNWQLSEQQALVNSGQYSTYQLLGILVQSVFELSSAHKIFNLLSRSTYYSASTKLWHRSSCDNSQSIVFAGDQLLAVLAQSRFECDEALTSYETLKKSELYEKNTGMWNKSMRPDGSFVDREKYAAYQLLGVICEALTCGDLAFEIYCRLKRSVLYDSMLLQWNTKSDSKGTLLDTKRSAGFQLLGVIAESIFDPKSAFGQFKQLLHTNLYDSTYRQWNKSMGANQFITNSNRCIGCQFLGLIAEGVNYT